MPAEGLCRCTLAADISAIRTGCFFLIHTKVSYGPVGALSKATATAGHDILQEVNNDYSIFKMRK